MKKQNKHQRAPGFEKHLLRNCEKYTFCESTKMEEELGKGAFGTVRTFNGLAQKTMTWDANEGVPYYVIREIAALRHLRTCWWVLKLVKIHIAKFTIKLDTRRFRRTLVDYRAKSEADTKNIIFRVLIGLLSAQTRGIMHRDIKPANIFLDSPTDVVIGDWGLSRVENANYSECLEKLSNPVQTQWYRAPEVISRKQQYDSKIDVWSVGCLLYEMLTNTVLFSCEENKNQEHLALIEAWVLRTETFLPTIVRKMIEPDPGKRLSIQECLDDSYFDEVRFAYELPKTRRTFEWRTGLALEERDCLVDILAKFAKSRKPLCSPDRFLRIFALAASLATPGHAAASIGVAFKIFDVPSVDMYDLGGAHDIINAERDLLVHWQFDIYSRMPESVTAADFLRWCSQDETDFVAQQFRAQIIDIAKFIAGIQPSFCIQTSPAPMFLDEDLLRKL
jgi:serine/threonine protein kinase